MFFTTRTEPPQLSGTKISKTERSKQIDVLARTHSSVSGGKTSCAHAIISTALRCSIITPFGLPVEPDV